MRAAIIDPGDFSPQYNLALTLALAEKLDECFLIGRHGFDETPKPACRRDHFYYACHLPVIRSLPPAAIKVIKGLSHGADLWRLRHWLDQQAIDVMHFQWLPLPAVDCRFLRDMAKKRPLVVTMHDSNPYNGADAGLMTRGLDGLLAQADAVIVHTNQAGRRLQERGLPAHLIRQVPHGLLHKSSVRVAKKRRSDHKLKLLQFGKIKHYKGVDILIEALRQLGPAIRERLEINVVGKAYMDVEPLQNAISAHGLENCIRLDLGYRPESDIEALFSDADAALFPYREIDASGVVMTAIAQGLPVIASRVGGFAELFADGKGGALFPAEDPTSLARILECWALNPEKLAQHSDAILAKRSSIPDWSTIADQTLAIYNDVLASRRSNTQKTADRQLVGHNG